MSNKIFTVSVGIPALNEQKNIKKLLLTLLRQKEIGFKFDQIIVASDGSTDNTEKEVLSVKDNRIKLLSFKDRKGQAARQNDLVKEIHSDLVLLLNADVVPSSDDFTSELVKPFAENPRLGLVSPRLQPLKTVTFFEQIINYSVRIKKSIFETWKNGDNLFSCVGAARMFRKEFIKNFIWPDAISEDAFSYLSCLEKGYTFQLVRTATINLRSPSTLHDHIKQSSRFFNGSKIMKSFFADDFVKVNYSIPFPLIVKALVRYFIRNPFFFCSYAGILITSKIASYRKKSKNNIWQVAASSKLI